VDFRFLAVPYDFDTSRKEWALHYIRGMLQSPVSLKKNSRWAIFSDDQHCVFGVACQVEKLVNTSVPDERQLCKDRAGRSLYAFVGCVTKMNKSQNINDIPPFSLDDQYLYNHPLQKAFVQVVNPQWQATSFRNSSSSKLSKKLSYSKVNFNSYQPRNINVRYALNEFCDDKVFAWPDDLETDINVWEAACQYIIAGQPISLCLGFGSSSMIIKSPFLNGTIVNINGKQILDRTLKTTISTEDYNSEYSSTEYGIYERFIEKLPQYFHLILNKLVEYFRRFSRKIFNLSRRKYMLKPLQITMLGDSSAGKTCYILAIYEGMETPSHPFRISTDNIEDDHDLTQLWSKLIYPGPDRWPEPTNQNKIYQFNFYEGQRIAKFEWIDYRGGILQENPNQNDVKEFNDYLSQTSCLFICLSGENFLTDIDSSNLEIARDQTKALYINKYLKKINSSQKKSFFPIVIAISKADLCSSRREKLTNDIKQLFPLLFAPNSTFVVLICPISLGRELVQNPDSGAINPINCHIPLLFALYCHLLKIIPTTNIEDLEEKLNNLLDHDFSFLNRWLRPGEIAELKRNIDEYEENYRIFQSIKLYLSGRYEEYEEPFEIYIQGKKHNIGLLGSLQD
jgi:GTPase SAR1 family protein